MSSSDWEKRSWNQLQGVWGKRNAGDAAAAAVRDSSVNDDDDDDESVSKFRPHFEYSRDYTILRQRARE
jgi:hypothetical protein